MRSKIAIINAPKKADFQGPKSAMSDDFSARTRLVASTHVRNAGPHFALSRKPAPVRICSRCVVCSKTSATQVLNACVRCLAKWRSRPRFLTFRIVLRACVASDQHCHVRRMLWKRKSAFALSARSIGACHIVKARSSAGRVTRIDQKARRRKPTRKASFKVSFQN